MGSGNLELVRSIVGAWETGDYGSDDWADPDIEFVIADGPAAGSWRGRDGLREGWGGFLEAWEGFHAQAEEFRELDDGRVLVLSRFGGRGRLSGMDVSQMHSNSATVVCLRGGRVTSMTLSFDVERALADLDAGG